MSLPKRKYHKRGELIDGVLAITHPLYNTWARMMQRCYNKGNRAYKNYGDRGIVVDTPWWQFANFVKDMGEKPTKHHTLERVNNDLSYSKFNCVWASRTEQCVNRRRFKSNKSGHTGVQLLRNGTYSVRFDYEYSRYQIGRFKSFDEAVVARNDFVSLFMTDRQKAIRLATNEKISLTSTTGVRGVVPHRDGGFTVRVTINGERKYIGYFKDFNEAVNARRTYDTKRN